MTGTTAQPSHEPPTPSQRDLRAKALRLGEGARGWETPEPLTAKPEGAYT